MQHLVFVPLIPINFWCRFCTEGLFRLSLIFYIKTGLNVHDIVKLYRHRLLVLFKLMMLERKVRETTKQHLSRKTMFCVKFRVGENYDQKPVKDFILVIILRSSWKQRFNSFLKQVYNDVTDITQSHYQSEINSKMC